MIEIIAEIGQNYNGEMVLAKELIHAAKENGADIAKFQVFDAKSLFSEVNNQWYESNLAAELNRDNVIELDEECKKVGIEFSASVFDCERIDWLEGVDIRRYKIASRSIYEKPLIKKLSTLNKPLIISLGMWEGGEFPMIHTGASVHFLYCVSKYPTSLKDFQFSGVSFDRYDGFSDHSIGISAALCALSRGARILEKHFTLDKKSYGPDHAISMTPSELAQLVTYKQELDQML